MNVNQPGVYTDISDNLPVYEESPGFYQYPYLSFAGKMTIFDNKLWLGTGGMACFTRPLSDFGYPPVVTEDKNEESVVSKEEFSVYPNPVDDVLNLKFDYANFKAKEIQILNIEGLLVQQISLTSQQAAIEIPVSQWSKGIYFIRITDQNGNSKSKKFIKT